MTVSLRSPQVAQDFLRLDLQLGTLAALAGKRLFITGGTGFFGRWLLAALAALNERGVPVCVDVLSRDPEAFLAREPGYRGVSWLRLIQGDVTTLAPGAARYDYVIHAATDTAPAAQADKPQLYEQIVDGARRVLAFASASGAQRILLTGSGAQYGRQPDDIDSFAENCGLACDPCDPDSAYGEAKRAAEMLAVLHAQVSGLEPVFARCFAFAGPGLPFDGHFAIGNFIRDALYRREITVLADREVWRSYLYGADLAIWLLVLLLRGEAGQAYNVGSHEFVTLQALAGRIGALLAPAKPVRLTAIEEGVGRSRYLPDTRRAATLGLVAWTSLDAIITHTACWAGEPDR
ncbi:NAD(P)-dependent oxidoreductase [Chitinimonas sp.]|uniref:NAD-dependent epimerase/dehydratase family protein n=1 Tax=Chitinimonas sp. TaxID=1934313 RepID=UPI002F91C93A